MATNADDITIQADHNDIVVSLHHGAYTTSMRMTPADLHILRDAIDIYIDTTGLRP